MSLASFQSESPRYVGEPDQSGTPLDSRLASLFVGPIVLFPFEERSLKGTRRVQCRQRPLSPPIKRAFIHSERQKTQTNHAESISHLVHQASHNYYLETACLSSGLSSTLSCTQIRRTRASNNRPRMACSYHRKSRDFDLFDCTTAHLHLACFSFVPREPVWHAVRSPTFTWPGIGSTSTPRLDLINWNKEQEEV